MTLFNYIDCAEMNEESFKTLEEKLKNLFGDKAVYLKSSSVYAIPFNTSELLHLADYSIKPIETHLRYALEEKK